MLVALILAATVQGPADVESLARAADAVVHAQVSAKQSAWGAGGGQIFTTVTLHVTEAWKGAAAPAQEIKVLVPGGAVGDLAQNVQGVAEFRAGEEVVVFLRHRAANVYAVERWALGKFSVGAAAANLPRRAMRDRSALSCAGCGSAEEDDLSLDDLRARVLRSVGK